MPDNDKKTLDYGMFLADLEAKRAMLEQAIASVRAVMASGALVSVGDSMPAMADSVSVGLHGGDVPVGAFLGKSIPEAAKLCLQIVKRKLTSREVAEFLKKGGIETAAKNFPTQVHSILTRAAKSHTSPILKLDRSHWGLADWYPAGVRSSAVGTDKRTTKTKKARKARPKNVSKVQSVDRKAPAGEGGVQERILQQLRAKPDAALAPAEIAAALGVRVQTIHFVLGKLAFRKQAERTTEGKYKAAAA